MFIYSSLFESSCIKIFCFGFFYIKLLISGDGRMKNPPRLLEPAVFDLESLSECISDFNKKFDFI
jgi:hypothetical protein